MSQRKFCVVLKNNSDNTLDRLLTPQGTWVGRLRESEARAFAMQPEAEAEAHRLRVLPANAWLSDPDCQYEITVTGLGWCRHPDTGAGRV